MSPFKSAYTEHQLKRWMRPDAHHFIRPDWRRFVKPGSELWSVYELYERKYRVDQLRDDHGRFADEGRDTGHGAAGGLRNPSGSDKLISYS